MEIDRKIQNLMMKQEKRQAAQTITPEEETRNDTRIWAGVGPVFGRNLLSVLLTDLINMLIDPVWSKIFQFFMDLAHFYIIPILGGVIAVIVKHSYEADQYSFELAGLSVQDLYITNMSLIKDGVYTLIGRPFMFDANPVYVPP